MLAADHGVEVRQGPRLDTKHVSLLLKGDDEPLGAVLHILKERHREAQPRRGDRDGPDSGTRRPQVNGHEAAQRFLDQLRAQTHASLGVSVAPIDSACWDYVTAQMLRMLDAKKPTDPQVLALMQCEDPDKMVDNISTAMLIETQDKIEKAAAALVTGVDLKARRPFIGHLQTGQLNAVSMRVPGRSGAHLVLFEDQMTLFAWWISAVAALSVPRRPPDVYGTVTLGITAREVTKQIKAHPEIVKYFADIVTTYAVTGRLDSLMFPWLHQQATYSLFEMLISSINYFVLGHENAHILRGHLDTTAARKGVLPVPDAEALVYSWQQELDADWHGMTLALYARHQFDGYGPGIGFFGIGLYFDALDLMDRAVALLQTGDENARQLGSHPPSGLRKQRLRDFLPHLLADQDPATANDMRKAIAVADEVQPEIIRLLWKRTRPILQELRRRGVPAASTWRTIPRETYGEQLPAPYNKPASKPARRKWRRVSLDQTGHGVPDTQTRNGKPWVPFS